MVNLSSKGFANQIGPESTKPSPTFPNPKTKVFAQSSTKSVFRNQTSTGGPRGGGNPRSTGGFRSVKRFENDTLADGTIKLVPRGSKNFTSGGFRNQTAGTRTGGGFHSTPRFNNPKTKLVRDKSGVGGTDTVYVQHL